MRAKAFLTLIITWSIFLFASCHKVLDQKPLDQITDPQLWGNQSNVVLYTNNFYSQLTTGFGGSNIITGGAWLMSCLTDDAVTANANSTAQKYYSTSSYDAYYRTISPIWTSRYTYIRRANIYLSKIDGVPGDPQLNKRLKAEVRFLRAYYYYDLVQYYGAVPIITVAQDPRDSTLFPVRNTLDSCQRFIANELDLAANDLPAQYSTADLGRITKQAAWGLKCRIQMMKASSTQSPQDWAAAAATAKGIMDLKANSLLTIASTDSSVLAKNYSSIFSTPNNAEMILSVQHNFNNTELATYFDYNNQSPYYGGLGSTCPTQNLVDDYEMMKTGLATSASGSGYNAANPYAGRDPRFYATILYDGVAFRNRNMQMYSGGQDMVNSSGQAYSNATTPTGYYLRKFINESITPSGSVAASGYNWPLIRYAEVLLNYAESQNKAVGPDASVQAAINQVRTRAGMPQVATNLTQVGMDTVIRHERRVELAFEDQRYWDAKRWGMAATWFNSATGFTPTRKVTITYNATTGVKTYSYGTNFNNSKTFAARNYLFPIPQSEIDIPGNKLTQNPGW
ncbi:RagB/SusD family nutrient uptake outer membrane protein [Pinibacter soli]|uniref:RagB/SusD family nutrient uptake outer membrane protein n=1 Tax=Pinibacter soli TaxID=3044211 RepID=A0ABT6RGP8_9BACT|nr:RagB/SusD family nutrient uptake outer membrane protein [Pinibacter soli]MDI3321738.1 RagB/SusD family nutrient uptake outer membrane protein [Pinibacter soli]